MSSRRSPCPCSVSSRSCAGSDEVELSLGKGKGDLGAGIISITCLRLRTPGTLCTQRGESAHFSPRSSKRAEGISREVCRWIPGWAANVGGWLKGGNTAWLPKPHALTETSWRLEISQALSILQTLHLIKKKTPNPQTKSQSIWSKALSQGGVPRSWRSQPQVLGCCGGNAVASGSRSISLVPRIRPLYMFSCGCGQTRS